MTHETEPPTPTDDAFAQRPALFVGAALLGGIILAQVLKHLGGDD